MAINVAVVGYGLSAKVFHIPLLLSLPQQFNLRGIVQRTVTVENDCLKDHPSVKRYSKFDDVLTDVEIQLVVLCTSPEVHYEQGKAALEAGKHLVVEKPFTPTSNEAQELIDIAKRVGRILTVYQNRRWDTDFLTLAEVIRNQKLGRIAEFETHFDRHRPDGPVAQTWKTRYNPAGGAVYDLGVHLIDQVVHIFGLPKRVTAFLRDQRVPGTQDENSDSATVILEYENLEAGAVMLATVKCGVVSPETEQLRYWVRGTTGSFKKFHLDVQEGHLRAGLTPVSKEYAVEPETHHGTLTQVSSSGSITSSRIPTASATNYQKFYAQLADAILGKDEVPVTADSARDVIKIIELAKLSSAEGRTVDVA